MRQASSWTLAATSRVNERLEDDRAQCLGNRGRSCRQPAIHLCIRSTIFGSKTTDNLAGGKRSTRDRLVPYCMFTDPPLARVGLSEREAQRQGVAARVARLPMAAVLRAQTTDETQGFMKALVGSDDRILGFTMIGAEAGEVMVGVQTSDAGKSAVLGATRCRPCASDDGGGDLARSFRMCPLADGCGYSRLRSIAPALDLSHPCRRDHRQRFRAAGGAARRRSAASAGRPTSRR